MMDIGNATVWQANEFGFVELPQQFNQDKTKNSLKPLQRRCQDWKNKWVKPDRDI